ncbi:phage regulatory CII family protein [Variovorax sp. HJSM1_2]|uniref:phage regulatory CII family protein n=1 Tax=Variovorax sp. HJSM1_2 TaxID=3366263 RepID=UPI003BECEDA3
MTPKNATQSPTQVNVHEAFRRLVYRYGVPDMAAEIGMVPGVLYNKADANDESRHQPTLRDVVWVTRISGDLQVLHALCHLFHLGTFDITPGPAPTDAEISKLLCHIGSEEGQMCQALARGFDDDRFCVDDFKAVQAEGHQLIRAVLQLLQRLEGLVHV